MGLRPRHTVGGQAWPTGSWSGRESAPSHRGKDLTLAKLRETLAVSNPGGLSRPFPGLGRGCRKQGPWGFSSVALFTAVSVVCGTQGPHSANVCCGNLM